MSGPKSDRGASQGNDHRPRHQGIRRHHRAAPRRRSIRTGVTIDLARRPARRADADSRGLVERQRDIPGLHDTIDCRGLAARPRSRDFLRRRAGPRRREPRGRRGPVREPGRAVGLGQVEPAARRDRTAAAARGHGRSRRQADRGRHAVPGRRAAAVEDRARQCRARSRVPRLHAQGALVQADYWLDRLGLDGFENRYPRHLSGGQRKRVALAQVLALMPKLLLMDEPFASLDAIVRARIMQDVASLVEQEGISVLLVTHDLEEAISLSDGVYLLSQGPRARITQRYQVPIPRPRDPVKARVHPAFAPLYEKLWNDLSHEVDFRAAPRRRNDASIPRFAWMRQLAAFGVLLADLGGGRRTPAAQPAVRADGRAQIWQRVVRTVRRRPHLAASRGDLRSGAGRARARHRGRHRARRRRGAGPARRRAARTGDDAAQRHPARRAGAAVRDLAWHRARVEDRARLHPGGGGDLLHGLRRHPAGRPQACRAHRHARRRTLGRWCAMCTCPRSRPGCWAI